MVTTWLCRDRGQPRREQAWAGGAEGGHLPSALPLTWVARKLTLRWPSLPGHRGAGKVLFMVVKSQVLTVDLEWGRRGPACSPRPRTLCLNAVCT